MAVTSVKAQTEFSRKTLKKEIRAKLKAEKYADADKQLRKAMEEHTELKLDVELNFIEAGIQDKLVEAENRKIFLNSGQDTTKYFSYIYGVYNYSIATGYANKKYRKTLSNYLFQYRNNLRSAGVFHYKKQQYNEAYKYFDMYLATTSFPLLTMREDYKADPDTAAIARLTAISALGSKQYSNALYYLGLALADTVNQMNMYELGVKAALLNGDTITAYGYMQKGWEHDSTSQFFCFSLLDYYQDRQEYDSVLAIINTATHTVVQPEDSATLSRLYYIRGKAYELKGMDAEAIQALDSATCYAPTSTKPPYNLGHIHLRHAHMASEDNTASPGTEEYKTKKAEILSIYTSAAKAFETVRRLAPSDTSLWLAQLRECYFKLNKGNELKKLEQYDKKP